MNHNVCADRVFENPEEELLKSEIVSSFRALVSKKHLTHDQVGTQWSIEPSGAAELLHSHWGNYSVNQLLGFSNALDRTL